MALENEINQPKFRNEYPKSLPNILYTNNWLSEKINTIFSNWDITPRQFNILRILRGEGRPLSTLQIRQRMLDKMSDTSRIVDRLVRKGMVRKTPGAADRRLVDVVITQRGRKLLEKIDPLEDEMDKMMETLSGEEASLLNRLLDKLRNVLPVVTTGAIPLLITGAIRVLMTGAIPLFCLLLVMMPAVCLAQQPDSAMTAAPDSLSRRGPGNTSLRPDTAFGRRSLIERPPNYEF